MYIIGGVGKNSYTNYVYHINLEDWSIKFIEMADKNGPDLLAFHKTIRYEEKLIIYGGQNSYKISEKYHTFNTSTHRWTTF